MEILAKDFIIELESLFMPPSKIENDKRILFVMNGISMHNE